MLEGPEFRGHVDGGDLIDAVLPTAADAGPPEPDVQVLRPVEVLGCHVHDEAGFEEVVLLNRGLGARDHLRDGQVLPLRGRDPGALPRPPGLPMSPLLHIRRVALERSRVYSS